MKFTAVADALWASRSTQRGITRVAAYVAGRAAARAIAAAQHTDHRSDLAAAMAMAWLRGGEVSRAVRDESRAAHMAVAHNYNTARAARAAESAHLAASAVFALSTESAILDAQTAMHRALQASDDFAAELAAQMADYHVALALVAGNERRHRCGLSPTDGEAIQPNTDPGGFRGLKEKR